MKIVVIGGHTRNIGKTSVMAGLLRDLTWLGWAAVKITQYGHGICSRDGQPCKCAPEEHPFVLTEEHDRGGREDTSRFLAAGARRSLWLRVRQGQLHEAFPLLMDTLAQEEWIMIESNSILGHLKPAVYLIVLNASESDFKLSARQFLDRANAFVTIGREPDWRVWDGLDPRDFLGRAVFPVSDGPPSGGPAAPDAYSSFELCRFVRQKLGVEAAVPENARPPAR